MEVVDRAKNYFSVSKDEIYDILFAVLMMGFMLTFRDWGSEGFSWSIGLGNLVDAALITLFVMLVYVSVQKAMGIKHGLRVTFHTWHLGMVLCVLITFLTSGNFFFFLPGGVSLKVIPDLTYGKRTKHARTLDQAIVGFSGVLSMLLLGFLFSFGSSFVLTKGFVACLLMAVGSMIPIPQFERFINMEALTVGQTEKIMHPRKAQATLVGLHILFFSRTWFLFCFVFTVLTAYFIFIHYFIGILSAVVIATVAGLIYFFWKEVPQINTFK